MFDIEKLILEVQLRSCLWNCTNKSYSDRSARKIAWEEIAKEFNNDWSSYSAKKKNETIDKLQKKWKHLRDYFIREMKRNHLNSGCTAPKKRNTTYFNMLNFLGDINLDSQTSRPILPKDEIESSTTISRTPSPTASLLPPSLDSALTPFQKSVLNGTSLDKPENDHDKNFLLSLLPEMQTMTERERFEFKFEIMSAIKRIKYSNPVEFLPDLSSSGHFVEFQQSSSRRRRYKNSQTSNASSE